MGVIHQVIEFDATPQQVYELLADGKKFAAFTGAPAEFDPAPGAAFKLFGGHIEGRNVELAPGERVVQAWRAVNWPVGVYSLVSFQLAAKGSGTTLTFEQVGHPDEAQSDLDAGWHKMYWEGMRSQLG